MSPSPAGDRRLLAAALAALIVVAGFYLLSGINTRDESWFLQVVTRVADGDVLYRDVFFGATPLSVWLTWPLVVLFGPQLAWVKLMVLAAFAVTLVLTTWIVRRLGAGTSAALLVAAAVLVFATPHRSSFYPPLATSCLVACLAAVLVWVDGGPRARLGIAGAGAAAGLAFAAKQNVGLLVLAAVFVAVLLAGVGRRIASWTLAGVGFLVCALLPLIPVAATGGFSAFLDYGFTNKGTYTDLGGISYPTGFREEAVDVRGFLRAGEVLDATVPAYHAVLYLLVPAILVLLLVAWARQAGVERHRVEVVGLFAAASAAAIFPRADVAHVIVVAPVLLIAGWYSAHLLIRDLAPERARLAAIGAGIVLLPGVLVLAAWPAIQVERGFRPSNLPLARGVLVDPGREEHMEKTAATLTRVGANGPLFLATSKAGFYYLLSGVPNPTPFDYPLATAFGRTGQEELVARIRRGEIAAVCLGFSRGGDLTPRPVVDAVRTTMKPGLPMPLCRVYRTPLAQ